MKKVEIEKIEGVTIKMKQDTVVLKAQPKLIVDSLAKRFSDDTPPPPFPPSTAAAPPVSIPHVATPHVSQLYFPHSSIPFKPYYAPNGIHSPYYQYGYGQIPPNYYAYSHMFFHLLLPQTRPTYVLSPLPTEPSIPLPPKPPPFPSHEELLSKITPTKIKKVPFDTRHVIHVPSIELMLLWKTRLIIIVKCHSFHHTSSQTLLGMFMYHSSR